MITRVERCKIEVPLQAESYGCGKYDSRFSFVRGEPESISARITKSAPSSLSIKSNDGEIQAQDIGVASKNHKALGLVIDLSAPVKLQGPRLALNKIPPKKSLVVHLTDEKGKEILPVIKRSIMRTPEKIFNGLECVNPNSPKSTDTLVLCGKPNVLENRLYQSSVKAISQSQDEQLHHYIRDRIGIQRMERGIYRIRSMSDRQVSVLKVFLSESPSKDLPFSVIAIISRYLWGKYSQSIAVFKPEDEVHGGKNGFNFHAQMSKDGIQPKSEIANEVIVAALRSPYIPITIQTSLVSDKFHIRDGGSKMITKRGMLQMFVPFSKNLKQIKDEGG